MNERFSLYNVILDIAVTFGVAIVITIFFGVYDSVRPDKAASTNTPKNFGLEYEPVGFSTQDGVRIAGWYVPSKQGDVKTTVIALHGYPADKGDILSRIVYLADRYNLLLIDFRYFGESEGKYTTVGAREVGDLLAAIDYARARGAERIGVYGFSMGAAVALMAVPKVKIDAVVAEAAYADLRHMVRQLYRFFGPLGALLTELTGMASSLIFGIDIDAVSPAKAVAGTNVPILLIHGRYDKVIPFENAELIALGLKDDPNAEFWFHEGSVHGEESRELPVKVGDFFQKHLSPPTQ